MLGQGLRHDLGGRHVVLVGIDGEPLHAVLHRRASVAQVLDQPAEGLAGERIEFVAFARGNRRLERGGLVVCGQQPFLADQLDRRKQVLRIRQRPGHHRFGQEQFLHNRFRNRLHGARQGFGSGRGSGCATRHLRGHGRRCRGRFRPGRRFAGRRYRRRGFRQDTFGEFRLGLLRQHRLRRETERHQTRYHTGIQLPEIRHFD